MTGEELFLKLFSQIGIRWREAAQQVAEEVGIPYLKDREGDGKRGPRVLHYREDGTCCGSGPGHLLPGEVDNAPYCFLDVPKALARLGEKPLTGIYFHMPTLNLVFTTEDDRIGIRSTCIRQGMLQLFDELCSRKAKKEAQQ